MELPGDLANYLEPYLDFTINDVKYRINEPGAKHGLRIRRIFTDPAAYAKLTDADHLREVATLLGAEWVPNIKEETVLEWVPTLDDDGNKILNDNGDVYSHQVPRTIEVDEGEYVGGAWSEMIDNGATLSQILHVGHVALAKLGRGDAIAIAMWTGGNDPKARKPKEPAPQAKNSPNASKGSTAGTIRGRARTTKKTPAAANQTR